MDHRRSRFEQARDEDRAEDSETGEGNGHGGDDPRCPEVHAHGDGNNRESGEHTGARAQRDHQPPEDRRARDVERRARQVRSSTDDRERTHHPREHHEATCHGAEPVRLQRDHRDTRTDAGDDLGCPGQRRPPAQAPLVPGGDPDVPGSGFGADRLGDECHRGACQSKGSPSVAEATDRAVPSIVAHLSASSMSSGAAQPTTASDGAHPLKAGQPSSRAFGPTLAVTSARGGLSGRTRRRSGRGCGSPVWSGCVRRGCRRCGPR